MGIQSGVLYGIGGFILDRLFNTGGLATMAGAAYGGLFRPDPGEADQVYADRRARFSGEARRVFDGFGMTDGLFGNVQGGAEQARPNAERAAQAQEKRGGGWGWGKTLLAGGAALLGMNLLDSFRMGCFGMPGYCPFFPGAPGLGPGIVPDMVSLLFGYNPMRMLFPF